MGKDKKERNPADAFRRSEKKKSIEKSKKDKEALRGVQSMLNDPDRIEEEIVKTQKLSNENKLDKTLKDKVRELKVMKDVALKKQQMLNNQPKAVVVPTLSGPPSIPMKNHPVLHPAPLNPQQFAMKFGTLPPPPPPRFPAPQSSINRGGQVVQPNPLGAQYPYLWSASMAIPPPPPPIAQNLGFPVPPQGFVLPIPPPPPPLQAQQPLKRPRIAEETVDPLDPSGSGYTSRFGHRKVAEEDHAQGDVIATSLQAREVLASQGDVIATSPQAREVLASRPELLSAKDVSTMPLDDSQANMPKLEASVLPEPDFAMGIDVAAIMRRRFQLPAADDADEGGDSNVAAECGPSIPAHLLSQRGEEGSDEDEEEVYDDEDESEGDEVEEEPVVNGGEEIGAALPPWLMKPEPRAQDPPTSSSSGGLLGMLGAYGDEDDDAETELPGDHAAPAAEQRLLPDYGSTLMQSVYKRTEAALSISSRADEPAAPETSSAHARPQLKAIKADAAVVALRPNVLKRKAAAVTAPSKTVAKTPSITPAPAVVLEAAEAASSVEDAYQQFLAEMEEIGVQEGEFE